MHRLSGRWCTVDARAITDALGGKWQGSYGLCRCPAHEDKTPSLKLRDDTRKADGIDLHCFSGCTWQEVKAELVKLRLIENFNGGFFEIRKPIAPVEENLEGLRRAQHIWKTASALPGTLGQKYFNEVRGLPIEHLGDISHAVRWHPDLKAVISLMTDPVTGDTTGIQRTLLENDATKRERMLLGHWGVVRVSPDEDVTEGLGIAEGVECAIAVLLSGWAPVWATCCAGNMARFPLLGGIEALTIFYDRDSSGTGRKAAEDCAERWCAAGREVFLK
jgi:putative DNA primase/helicase